MEETNSKSIQLNDNPEIMRKLSEYSRNSNSYIIGLAGGTASGKSTFCKRLKEGLKGRVLVVAMDSFYKGLAESEDPSETNFDHPDSLDWGLVLSTLNDLYQRKSTKIPVYNFKLHKR